MVSISWKDLWSFFGTADVEVKKSIVSNLIKDDWLENLSTDMQVNVLRGCPEYLTDYLSPRLSVDALLKLAGTKGGYRPVSQSQSNVVVSEWVKTLGEAEQMLKRKASRAEIATLGTVRR